MPTNNREALHTKLRKRFHLEPLKQLIEQGYISDCVIIEIRQAIERLEADRTASRKKEDNQPKLTAFYMSSTCSNSKKLDSDTDSESTSTSSTNNDSDSEIDNGCCVDAPTMIYDLSIKSFCQNAD